MHSSLPSANVCLFSPSNPPSLLCFPAEIRLEIYHHIVADTCTDSGYLIDEPCSRLPLCSLTRSGKGIRPEEEKRDWKNALEGTSRLAIAFTCRQLYLEAAEVYYGSLIIHFRRSKWMEVFIDTIGRGNKIQGVGGRLLDAVRHIRIRWEDEHMVNVAALFSRLERIDLLCERPPIRNYVTQERYPVHRYWQSSVVMQSMPRPLYDNHPMLDANIAYYWRENPAPSFTNDSTQLPVLPKARQWDLRLRSNWTEEAGQVHFLWVKLPNPYLLGWIGGFRHLERVFFYHEQARHLPSEWGFWVDVEEHWNRVWTSGRCKWCSRTRRRVRRSTDACSFLRIQMTL